MNAPSKVDNNNEDIINSGSKRFALKNKFFPNPILAPVNSATIAPITDRVAATLSPEKILGKDKGK